MRCVGAAEPIARAPALDARHAVAGENLRTVVEFQAVAQRESPFLPVAVDDMAIDHLRLRLVRAIDAVQSVEHHETVIPSHIRGRPHGIEHGEIGLRDKLEHTAALGGGEAGYNLQSGSVVVGIEATGFWSNLSGNDAVAVGQGLFPNVTAVDADNLRWGGTLRARGGVTVDRLMLFFTGGWAFGDIQHTNTALPPVAGLPVVDQFTVHANGLVAGGGIAYALTNNLIGKIEYSYYNFNGYNRPAVGATGLTSNGQLPYTTESTYSIVTVGLDYKFGGPVVAKY